MRARRRGAFNTISAAILEVTIMGLFVIIAQPQLRDALFEILHPNDPAYSTPAARATGPATFGNLPGTTSSTTAGNWQRNIQSAIESPLGQAVGQSLTQWSGAAQPRTSNYAPLDQYESFSVTVPVNSDTAMQIPSLQDPRARVNYPSTSQAPTQLTANQWNIASAAQSPQPGAKNQWMPVQTTEVSNRDIYPPPYGTQSMWK